MSFLSKTEKRKEMFGCIVTFLFILCSPDTILVGTNSAPLAVTITRYSPFLWFIVMGAFYILKRKRTLPRSDIVVACILVLCFSLTANISPGDANILNLFYHCAAVMGGILIVGCVSFKQFVHYFEKTMFFLAVGSLLCFGLATVSPETIKIFPSLLNVGNVDFYCLGFSVFTKYSLIDSFYLRNFGIFREPGVYQMFLNFALCCYLFCKTDKKQHRILKIAVYLAALLTTTSTTGLFAMAVLMLAFISEKNPDNKKVKRWVFIAGIAMVVLVFSGVSDKLLFAINKLADPNHDSTVSRLGSISANIKIFLEYPLFGVGQAEIGPHFAEYLGASISATHNTNTVLFMFACYGFVVGIIYLYGNCRLMCKFSNDRIARVLLCFFFILLMSGENLTNSYYIYALLMYGYIDDSVVKKRGQFRENSVDKCMELRQYGSNHAGVCRRSCSSH